MNRQSPIFNLDHFALYWGNMTPSSNRPQSTGTLRAGSASSQRPSLALFVLLILLIVLSLAGVMMLAQRIGLVNLPSLLWEKKEAAEAPAPVVPESVKVTVVVSSSQTPTAGDLVGRIVETEVGTSDLFASTGAVPAKDARSRGIVTVTNTTSRPYAFVVKTRFLSKGGVLFRATAPANIPVKGTADVPVSADKPGPEGDIGPTTFTIPGLPASIQDEVYGASAAKMTGGSGTVIAVSEADLASARAALEKKLMAEAIENVRAMARPDELVLAELMSAEEVSMTVPKAGDETASFTMKLTLKFSAMLAPKQQILDLLSDELVKAVPPGEEGAYGLGEPVHMVQAYDPATGRVEIRAEAELIRTK